jgi:hypothetical protein
LDPDPNPTLQLILGPVLDSGYLLNTHF